MSPYAHVIIIITITHVGLLIIQYSHENAAGALYIVDSES